MRKPIVLSFSGSREGMSPFQVSEFTEFVTSYNVKEFHHGCCVGADIAAHRIVRLHTRACSIHGHPSNWRETQFEPIYVDCSVLHPPKPPLVRNRDIVDPGDVLVAAPLTTREMLRGGTWSAIRYARERGKKVLILKRFAND
jgi:hypothetical protein